MPLWKVALFTLFIIPALFGLYILFFDISSTTPIEGVILDAQTGAPIPEVLIYSQWIGDKLGSRISGIELYGRSFTKSDLHGKFFVDGIVPGLNFPGLFWLTHQELEFHHPAYLNASLTIKRDQMWTNGQVTTITLTKAAAGIASEAELGRYFGAIKRAYGLEASSLLMRARRENVVPSYQFAEFIGYWDTEVFSKYPNSSTTRFSWPGFREQLRKGYRIHH